MTYDECDPKPQDDEYWWVKRLSDNELDIARIVDNYDKVKNNHGWDRKAFVQVFMPCEQHPYHADEINFVCRIEKPE